MTKRPWLPKKHVFGLIGVGVFIVGSLIGISAWSDVRFEQLAREGVESEARYESTFDKRLQRAMNSNDREAFISAGTGEGAKQLAAIWDGTKKIGWTLGDFEEGVRGEAQFSFQLGFDVKRNEDASWGTTSTGRLAQTFKYKVTLSEGEYKYDRHITRLVPEVEMPWDKENGIAVVKNDTSVVFGFADEADEIKRVAPDISFAANGVLSTGLYKVSTASVPGFAVFYTGNDARYRAMISDDASQDTAGVTVNYGVTMTSDIAQKNGMAQRNIAAFAMINGERAKASPGGVRAVAAHELAHVGHALYFDMSSILGETYAGSTKAVKEGYATYIEKRVVGRSGDLRTPAVKALVARKDVHTLLTDENIGGDAAMYALAGSYADFMAAKGGVPIMEALDPSSYEANPFDAYADKMTGDGTMMSGVKAWQQWMAQQ